MAKFDNPLDNVRVASPCRADWDEMYGDDRKRFCIECRMSVYNLSGMTREDAESLLISAEGRLCVRYFRRTDGTVLTRDCPVGWRAAKQRVSKVATAVFSMIAGLFAGVSSFSLLQSMAEFVAGPPDLRSVRDVVPEYRNDIAPAMDPDLPEDMGWRNGEAIVGRWVPPARVEMGKPAAIYLKNSEGKGLRAK
jgi:hypothetical protein